MQQMLSMVRKDLLRQLRSPMGLLFSLSFPVIFAALIALTFGTGSQPAMPRAHILVQDLDGSFLSGALLSATGNEQMAEYFEIEQVGEEGLERLENNEASALWRIPANFQQDLLDGKAVEFELIRNPAQSILPEIAEQGLAVLSEVLSSAARVLREPLDELRPMLEAQSAPGTTQIAALSVRIRSRCLIAGTLPRGLIARYSGVLQPAKKSVGMFSYSTPSSSSIQILRPAREPATP